MERNLALEPDQSGSESRFHQVQAAGPWAWNVISPNLSFLNGKDTGVNRPFTT